MVQELRRISLAPDELLSAFESYRRLTPHFLPDGKIVMCTPTSQEVVSVCMETTYGNSAQRSNFDFKVVDLLRPLLRFCLENNIVLPIDGRKSVEVVDGAVCLSILLRMDADVLDNVTPMKIENLLATPALRK